MNGCEVLVLFMRPASEVVSLERLSHLNLDLYEQCICSIRHMLEEKHGDYQATIMTFKCLNKEDVADH